MKLDMKKIIVIGCPGSGKSTFSKKLNAKTGIPLFHLDMMYWSADKSTVDKVVFLQRLSEVLKKDEWIIDGNYASSMEQRMAACDTVFFLDYPLDVCLDGIKERMGKPRSDMPWVENETDEDFVEFIKRYNHDIRPIVLDLLQNCRYKNIIIFTNREQADEFLSELTN